MRLITQCVLITAALLGAVDLYADEPGPDDLARNAVDAFLVDIEPYEQPCEDLPVFDFRPKAEVVEAAGLDDLPALAREHGEDVKREAELGKAVDEAHHQMVLHTVNHLRYVVAQTEPHKSAWAHAQSSYWTMLWYHAMLEQFKVGFERRNKVRDGYYEQLIRIFPTLEDSEQKQVVEALAERMTCLQVKRRGAFAGIQRHRKEYAEHLEALDWEQRWFVTGLETVENEATGEQEVVPTEQVRKEAARVAAAAIGEANANRAYLWLVAESTLNIQVYSGVLKQRETYLRNKKLHDLRIAALRANPGLKPHDPLPPDPARTAVLEKIFELRKRRAALHLYLEDMQLEAAFKRSTSWLSSSLKAVETARDNGIRIYNGIVRNPEFTASIKDPMAAWHLKAGVTTAAAFAVGFRLAGDLLTIMAVQPLVDASKDNFFKPLFNPLGFGIQNSIEKAWDGYWKSRAGLDDRIRFIRKLSPATADGFVAWARSRGEPIGLEDASAAIVTALLETSSFVEGTDGGLSHIFAAVCEDPADLVALYIAGAYFEQRGNAKAAASRIAVSRAIHDVADAGGELGAEVVERIISPISSSVDNAVDSSIGFFANTFYLNYQLVKIATVDLIWNAPTRFRLLVAYNTHGNPLTQDEYLRTLQQRQGHIADLRGQLADNGYDYRALEKRSPVGHALHIALAENAHEYAAAYRRIRAEHWEREKRWIWARHEDEHSRARNEEPRRLSPTGAWAESKTITQEEMEISRLAYREAKLRATYLANTVAYEAAASQVRQLPPIAITYFNTHKRRDEAAVVEQWCNDQAEALEAEALRGEAVAMWEGLYKTVLVETTVSLVSTGLVNSVVGRAEGAGRLSQFAAPTVDVVDEVSNRIWQTLNPWAGKFSKAGVYNLTKNAAIQGFRETVAQAATDNWINQELGGPSETRVDETLDILFSVAEESVEKMGDVIARSDIDWQADTELYRDRYEATKKVDEALADIDERMKRATTDEERARLDAERLQRRAQRALITGEAGDPEVMEAGRRHLTALEDGLRRDKLQDDAAAKVVGESGEIEPHRIEKQVQALLTASMRDRLNSPAIMADDIRRLVDPDDYLKLGDRIFRDNGFDIQSIRHALVRAARNDPQRSVELLAYAMALDRQRAQVSETVFNRLAEDPRFYGKVAVLRDTNRVAIIGDDPAHRGSLDTPGLFVDQEFDVVIRDGADVTADDVRRAVDALFLEQGYRPPTSEGARHTTGVRAHIQSEAAIRERGRKSGRRSLLAEELLEAMQGESPDGRPFTTRFDDPGKPLKDYTDEELARLAKPDDVGDLDEWMRLMETERGLKGEHAWRMHLMAQLYGAIIVVRNGNTDSLKHVGNPNLMPKDMTCKAKTARVGDQVGLVVNPRHKTQAEAWDSAIRDASPAEAESLRYHRKRAEEAWDKYGAKMLESGNYKEGPNGEIQGRKPDGTWSDGIHGDYDLHEAFVQGPGGRWVRVSFGDGSKEDNLLRAPFRALFNLDLDAVQDMFLHGGQGDWDHPGKTADPPVTIFAPSSVFATTGIRSGHGAGTAEELRDIFENKLGTGWAYSDGHGDLDPVQGIFRDRHFTSVGGQRWLANRTIPGLETPADGPNAGTPVPVRGWIPIPMWLAYGVAVEALPDIGFLADPAYEADAVAALANTTERCLRLDTALRSVDGFFQLVDAWVISQAAGNREYNEARQKRILEEAPDWRRQMAGDVPRARAGAVAGMAGIAEQLQAGPSGLETSPWRHTLIDVEAMNTRGVHSLFAGEDSAKLGLLLSVVELGARYDPFAPLGGRTPQGVAKAVELIDWMRAKAAAMYADIGVAFWSEYERMTLDGVEVEERYALDEAYRITARIDQARANYPDLVVAFLRPPMESDGERLVPQQPSALSAAILTDVHAVLGARRTAAAARRAGDAIVQGDGAVAAFTSAAATDDDPRIFAWIETWRALSERS